jgi:hypothetical protein
MAVGNGNGRAWLDKWTGEIVRLSIVGLIALAGAYMTLGRQHEHLFNLANVQCRTINTVRDNQRTVLLSQLTLIDTINDRPRAGLRPIPRSVRDAVLNALATLPEQRDC